MSAGFALLRESTAFAAGGHGFRKSEKSAARSDFSTHDGAPRKTSLQHRNGLHQLHSPQQRADILARRAQRLRQKGELRGAAMALREACALAEGDAARWMMLGDLHVRLGKRRDAERAMKQALYLREQGGERRKAQVIRRLLSQLNDAGAGAT